MLQQWRTYIILQEPSIRKDYFSNHSHSAQAVEHSLTVVLDLTQDSSLAEVAAAPLCNLVVAAEVASGFVAAVAASGFVALEVAGT